jgi:hypothetical protein
MKPAARYFIACDREQEQLLPPSLREWLPDDHLAWFVVDAVEAMICGRSLPAIARMAGVGRRTSGDDGGAADLRLRDRCTVLAADRATLP